MHLRVLNYSVQYGNRGPDSLFWLYAKRHSFLSVFFLTSNFLISRAVSNQVPSAFVGLTTVFGMGTGGAPQLSSLDIKLGEHLVRVCSLKTSQKKDCAISLIQCLHFMQTRYLSQVLGLLVPVSSIDYSTSTSGLSTL